MATNVHLTPELENFARACVDSGRFNNVSEVVRSGLRLLQNAEERRQQFGRMLADVQEDVDRNGALDLDTVVAEMDAVIAAAER